MKESCILGQPVKEVLKRVETKIKRDRKFQKEIEVLKKTFKLFNSEGFPPRCCPRRPNRNSDD